MARLPAGLRPHRSVRNGYGTPSVAAVLGGIPDERCAEIGRELDRKHPALPGLQAIVADRGHTRLLTLANSHGLNLDIKVPPAPPMLPPTKPGGNWHKGKRTFTPLRPLYKVENAFARLGMWRRLSRCYEQTWMEVACVAYLCRRLRVEPT